MVHGLDDLPRDGLRQVRHQVREVVQVEAFGGGDQFVDVHAAYQLGPDLVIEFDEHVAVAVLVDELPDDLAFGRWEGFEQVGYLGRAQRVDLAAHAAESAAL